MKKNMGNIDRILRLIVAAVFVYAYFGNLVEGTVGMVLMILAIIFAATSLISFCPLYLPFGLSTRGGDQ